MTVERDALLAVGATISALQSASTPVRQHSYQKPPFYARPLNATRTRYFAGNTLDWSRRLVAPPQENYVGVVTSYTIAADVDLAGSGLEFRITRDGVIVPGAVFTDADLCREGAWPAFKRPTYLVFTDNQSVAIEARNLGALTRRLVLGLFGFYYPSPNAGEEGVEGADHQA